MMNVINMETSFKFIEEGPENLKELLSKFKLTRVYLDKF